MARKKRKTIAKDLPTSPDQSARFRQRYQDGVVELGIGVLLMLLTFVNLSEYLFDNKDFVRWLVLLQPVLSLILFAGGVYLIRAVRKWVLQKWVGVEMIPLTKPMLWINLVMLLLLITAPLVWPLQRYDAHVTASVLGGLGCIAGLIFAILGVRHQFQRFLLVGGVIFVLAAAFTYVGQPGSLANQLVILLGTSGTLLISGGYSLWRFLQGVDPYK